MHVIPHVRWLLRSVLIGMLPIVLQAKSVMTIFVHGTVDNKARHAGSLLVNECMLAEGLVPIDLSQMDILNSRYANCPYAAYHIVHAFDVCDCEVQSRSNERYDRHYYTFGWSGALSDIKRRQASQMLYQAIRTEWMRLRRQDKDIEIELYGHSHGGTIILLGAEYFTAESLGASIDRVFLFATPLHPRQLPQLLSGLFRQITNFYSLGDRVQMLDQISVPFGTVCRTLREVGVLDGALRLQGVSCADVAVGLAHDFSYFGHNSFFTMDRYSISRLHPWLQPYTKAEALALQIHPLPLLTLMPLLQASLYHQPAGYATYVASLEAMQKGICWDIEQVNQGPDAKDMLIACYSIPDQFFQACSLTRFEYRGFYPSQLRKIWYAIRSISAALIGTV